MNLMRKLLLMVSAVPVSQSPEAIPFKNKLTLQVFMTYMSYGHPPTISRETKSAASGIPRIRTRNVAASTIVSVASGKRIPMRRLSSSPPFVSSAAIPGSIRIQKIKTRPEKPSPSTLKPKLNAVATMASPSWTSSASRMSA